jgi:sugar phosphate isomerase/epimerase
MAKIPLSLQLYTVRDQTAKDFAGTVRQIAGMGYAGVELAGYGNLKTAGEVKKAVDDAGLVVSGAHVAIDRLEKELDAVLEEQRVLGNRIVICPWLAEERRKSGEIWRANAASLERIGAGCAKAGFEFAYHHHAFEFETFDGRSAMDIVWQGTDPRHVKAEVDVYWVKYGGLEPVAFIEQLGKRVILLHFKDLAAGEERRFAEVGSGVIDFKAVVAAGRKVGVKWYAVEQDNCYGKDPLACVKASAENLREMGLA